MSTNQDMNNERRAFVRVSSEIAVKLRANARIQYSGGRTIDVSLGGASLELHGPRETQIGDRVAVAFENLQCPVTRAARMIGGEVVRVGPMHNGRQQVAIRFDCPQHGIERLSHSIAA